MFNNVFFRKSCSLRDNVENYGRARQVKMTVWYRAEKMRFSRGVINARIQTHIQNIQYVYLLLFHGNSGYANAL